jgi:signal peptidase
MNKVIKKIGAAVVSLFIVVLILFSIIISISSVTAKANNGVPDLFGYTPFSVQTNSMKPTISKGDYIFVEKCDAETLKVGDIVTYFTIIDGKRVVNTHRIVNVYTTGDMIEYQTQGDNKETNPEPDEMLLSPGDVIGKFTGTKIPVLGSVIDFLSTQLGFFLVILLPVLLFTIYQIYKLIAVLLYNHKVDMINAVNESASDEVKEAIIAEYLAKQKSEETEDKKAEDEKSEDEKE